MKTKHLDRFSILIAIVVSALTISIMSLTSRMEREMTISRRRPQASHSRLIRPSQLLLIQLLFSHLQIHYPYWLNNLTAPPVIFLRGAFPKPKRLPKSARLCAQLSIRASCWPMTGLPRWQ